MKYNIYLGGNHRHIAQVDAMWDASLTPSDFHVEYAAHLKTRHKTVQYHWDGSDKHVEMFMNQKGLKDIAVNDELGVVLLAEGSYMEQLVFHNKKAVAGGRVKVILNGTAGDTPVDTASLEAAVATATADVATAQAAATSAQVELDSANSAVGSAQTNLTLAQDNGDAAAITAAQTALADAQAAKDTAAEAAETANEAVATAQTALTKAQEAITAATTQEIASMEIDLSKVGYTLIAKDLLLQTNGDVTVQLLAGSMVESCWTVSPALVHHNDQHECSCKQVPCDTVYPEHGCQPFY